LTLSSLARGFLLRAALSLFGLGIALLLGEAAVRWLHLGPLPLTVFRPHPTRMFALAPGREVQFVDEDFSTRVAISRDGLRNPPLAPPETAGRPRVLALGDSFTFGYGVETAESWPARLQAALREDGLPRAEVINAGVVAYAPDQQLDLLRELLPRSRPDAVILGLYVGNDRAEIGLHRSAPPLRVSPEGALLEFPTAADLNPHPIRLWIARHLRLYSFARVRIHRLLIRLDLRQEPRLYHPAYFLDALGSTDAYEGNWPGLKRLLRDMDRATRASGARFLLAILPMDVQVSERYWTHYPRRARRRGSAPLRPEPASPSPIFFRPCARIPACAFTSVTIPTGRPPARRKRPPRSSPSSGDCSARREPRFHRPLFLDRAPSRR
jgi:hypothetical protein